MIKVAFTGGRDYRSMSAVTEAFDYLIKTFGRKNLLIIHGDAKGLDTLVNIYCNAEGLNHKRFKANWEKYGRNAGAIRNKEMVKEEPDFCVYFSGGYGTQNMKDQCMDKGIPLYSYSNFDPAVLASGNIKLPGVKEHEAEV